MAFGRSALSRDFSRAVSTHFRNVPSVTSLEVSPFFPSAPGYIRCREPLPECSPTRPLGRAFRAKRRQWLAASWTQPVYARGGLRAASSAKASAVYPPNGRRPVRAAAPRSHDVAELCFYSESRFVRLPIHTPSPWLAAGDNRWSAPVENNGFHSAPPSHWKCSARSPDRTLAPVRAAPVAGGDSCRARPARAQTGCCVGPDILLARNDLPLRACGSSGVPSS